MAMDKLKRTWLQALTWTSLLDYLSRFWQCDAQRCRGKGYDEAMKLWTAATNRRLTLHEALEVCRKCQALQPFGSRNGDSFAVVARLLVQPFTKAMPPTLAATVIAVVNDYVAGRSDDDELGQIMQLVEARIERAEDYEPPTSLLS